MTGRERIERMIDGLPVDRVPISTIANDVTRANMPPEWRDIPILEFYRKLGYDHFQFGNFALKREQWPRMPYIRKCGYTVENEVRGDIAVTKWSMNGQSIELHTKAGHPVKYPVNDEEELRFLCEMWETVEILPPTQAIIDASIAGFHRIDNEIGDMGIYVPWVECSAVQRLLEYDMGVENFYYLLEDEPDLVEKAIELIQKERQARYEYMAKYIPAKTIVPIENTSTALISPTYYRKYTMPHMQKYAETMHKYGKKAIIHMCGHLYDLLPSLKEIGLDGIHSLTPPPTGNCPYEAALDALGDDLVVITGFPSYPLRDKSISLNERIEQTRKLMKETLTPRIMKGNFCFGLAADGRSTPIEHFEIIRDLAFELGVK